MTLRTYPSQCQELCKGSPAALLASFHKQDCSCLSCPPLLVTTLFSFLSLFFRYFFFMLLSCVVLQFISSLHLCADVTCPETSLLGHRDRPWTDLEERRATGLPLASCVRTGGEMSRLSFGWTVLQPVLFFRAPQRQRAGPHPRCPPWGLTW